MASGIVLTNTDDISEMSGLVVTIFDMSLMALWKVGFFDVFEVRQEMPYIFQFCVHKTQNKTLRNLRGRGRERDCRCRPPFIVCRPSLSLSEFSSAHCPPSSSYLSTTTPNQGLLFVFFLFFLKLKNVCIDRVY